LTSFPVLLIEEANESAAPQADAIRRVCYLLLRIQGKRSTLQARDLPSLDFCSHLIVSDVQLDSQFRITFHDAYNDSQVLRTLVARKKAGQLVPRILLSIGGAQNQSNQVLFAELCSEPQQIRRFVDSALELITLYDLDGFDLNFKFPVPQTSHVQPLKYDLPKLLQVIRGERGA
jgi:GH18 family chitinase